MGTREAHSLNVGWACLVGAAIAGCGRAPARSTAEGAVAGFLAAADAFGRDPAAQALAFSLLCASARDSLREASQRATALGLPLKPEQMLAPRWSSPAFVVERFVYDGKRAVDLYGTDPKSQHARVQVGEEEGGFCVKP